MHGEYKPPGGKLDVEVVGGQLARMRISGDFFLEPDDALDRVNAALTGIPVTADASVITTRITAALGTDAVLAGFTAGAAATAVRRALTRASGWRDHDWRLIRDEPQDPALHMALEEVLAREVAAGRRPPTLRIWEWSAPAVGIGSFQSLRREVDTAEAGRRGMTVVRRISGGGAMFVEPGNTITYSLYAPESLVAGMSHAESYGYLDDWVIGALTDDLGVSAWYQPLNDITSAQGKIGGAAQKRPAGGAMLRHVTMAYDIDAGAMTRVLRIGREKLPGKGIPSAVKRVGPLRRQTRLPRAEIIDTLAAHFRRRYGLTPDAITGGELRAARASWPGRSSPAASGRRGMTTRTTEPEPCPRLGRLVRGFALASVVANAVRTSWIVLAGLGVQAAIGYAQYLSHLPAGLVWVHVGISVVLWILGLRLYLSTRKGGLGGHASATASRGYAIAPAA